MAWYEATAVPTACSSSQTTSASHVSAHYGAYPRSAAWREPEHLRGGDRRDRRAVRARAESTFTPLRGHTRHSDPRVAPCRRGGADDAVGVAPRRPPQPDRGVRLSVPPPASRVHRGRERVHAWPHPGPLAQRDGAARVRAARRGGAEGPRALHRPGELSGGEQQRASPSRGRSYSTPNSSSPTSRQATSTPRRALQDPLTISSSRSTASAASTIVVVTHNTALAASMPRVVTLKDGRVEKDERRGMGIPAVEQTA